MDTCDELNDITKPPWGEFGRLFTFALVSAASKLYLKLFNTVTVANYDTYLRHVTERERPVGLVTISNHTCAVDDPSLISAITPWWYFLTGNPALRASDAHFAPTNSRYILFPVQKPYRGGQNLSLHGNATAASSTVGDCTVAVLKNSVVTSHFCYIDCQHKYFEVMAAWCPATACFWAQSA